MQQEEELSPDELTALLSSYMPEIPGYRVLRRIGKGGMSQVYLSVQESLDRQVAIKVMSPAALTDEISKQRFEHEARTIAKLEHPCIVGIHEVGRTRQGLLYYVLPYLAKGHLGQRDFTHDEDRAIEVLRSLLSALEYAHARGIVHRDVKAENVLFDNADRPLLTDFGIALSKRDQTRITTAGLAVGSGGYMAPEQARGEVVDGRADLYSVGVLAYELLMGRLPYQAADPLALALMHAQDPVPRLPPEKKHWQPFLDRAMAKSPDNRYRNAQQMLSALNQIANGKPPEPAVDLAKLRGAVAPYWKPALAAIAGVAVVAVALAWFLRDPPAAAPESDFFTVQDAPAVVAPATTPAPDEAPPQDAVAAPAPAEAATPADAAAAPAAPFAQVSAEVTVHPLDYDPTRPGARELAAARRQIDRQRLSLPPGDNAMESLRAARDLAPREPAIARLADEVVAFYAGRIVTAVESGQDQDALDDHARVAPFVEDMARAEGAPWTRMREALVPALLARLQAGLEQVDADAVARTKSLAGSLAIDPAALEPAWSQAVQLPKAGDPIDDNGVAMVLVSLPRDGRPGLAAMRTEVTRGEYAAFDAASGRAEARCRNRLAPISLKRRSWDDPGFGQAGTHPVVCVSFDDARAYAQWLGRRTGHEYRLPTRAEWVPLASYRGTGNACRDGRIACGNEGTVAASQGPASHLGLTGMRGNAREWLSDCDRGCARRLVGGVGWRDPAARANPQGTNDFDADTGFDDVGFRLVREVTAEELAAR
ncbi:MAG TPA: bifunctional serine/threonine-protein kinase/formylglycine-generating enzyme family protein [Arenimonas sp.]|uniref:bifunctional serine/threonine-protein kinase/formylglycine-generating enzyme family protein n=1 Tax=Arenimonas sp. TaxID=1872635 RepID=UPI002D810FBA|nr:bifunctional serine/threonine-protein kinase/formylglycine-generating enzyme family protein [Arenimonas sp.]HEU0152817.1 bifunctional serine/threonine-protein kinase/formylglycine-generating enzyme family protein [Arenimonas sp.]